jgi:hypothetical protein
MEKQPKKVRQLLGPGSGMEEKSGSGIRDKYLKPATLIMVMHNDYINWTWSILKQRQQMLKSGTIPVVHSITGTMYIHKVEPLFWDFFGIRGGKSYFKK